MQFFPYVLCTIAGLLCGLPLAKPALLAAAVVARLALALASSGTYVAAPELYPTAVRSTGANVAYVLTLIGGIFSAPWVYAGSISLATKAIGLAACNLVVALLVLALPETAGAMSDADAGKPAATVELEGDDESAYGTFAAERGKGNK